MRDAVIPTSEAPALDGFGSFHTPLPGRWHGRQGDPDTVNRKSDARCGMQVDLLKVALSSGRLHRDPITDHFYDARKTLRLPWGTA